MNVHTMSDHVTHVYRLQKRLHLASAKIYIYIYMSVSTYRVWTEQAVLLTLCGGCSHDVSDFATESQQKLPNTSMY